MIAKTSDPRRQRGAVLLVLFMALFIFGSTLFLSSVNSRTVDVRRQSEIRYQMEQAKAALIAHAVNYENIGTLGPGHFPCPDTDSPTIDTVGAPNPDPADCTDYVRGRLPKSVTYTIVSVDREIRFNDAYAGTDQQFWYVVSPNFTEISDTAINSNSSGDLTIDGKSGFVAVIIYPGEQVASQNRSAADTTVGNYLEQDNATGTTAFINAYPTNPDAFDDIVLGISMNDIKTAMARRAAEQLRIALADYLNTYGHYPYTKSFNWFDPTFDTFMSDSGAADTLPDWFRNAQDNWLGIAGYDGLFSGTYSRFYFAGCSTRFYPNNPVSSYTDSC